MVVVMDIQNFETAYLNAGGKASELEKEDGEYTSSKAQMAWEMWHAAQAVPEGFILVPREMPKSFDEGLYVYSNNISIVDERSEGFIPMSDINHTEVWKLVIEAQGQSHD